MKVTQFVTTQDVQMKQFESKKCGSFLGGVSKIVVSDKAKKDKFNGFGVAITHSSCYLLDKMPEKQRKSFLKDIYTDSGLDLSVGRLTIGSSDYSPYLYTYDDVPNDIELSHFTIERDEGFVIPIIKEILKTRKDLYLYAAPWSPPGWMKTGDSICGGYMRENFVDCYADYFVKFIEEYKKHGIDVKAVNAQNEPETQQRGTMPACIWHPEIEAKFVIRLYEKLKSKNVDTDIWLYDNNFDGYQRVLWQLENYPVLKSAVKSVAWHYYTGAFEMIDCIKEKYPEIEFNFTEGGPRLFDNYSTDFTKWSTIMIEALRHNCKSFCGWNLILDENGGPNIGPFFCAGLATVNSQTGELSYSGQYKAFKHLTKIKRDAEIFDTKLVGEGANYAAYPKMDVPVHSVFAKNPDGTRVLVISNTNTTKQQLQMELDGEVYYFELLPDSVSTVVFE